MKLTRIATDHSLMELIPHGTEDFPFQYYQEDIRQFDFGKIDWHWHQEFEFVSVTEGTITCFIGNCEHILEAGDGLFINSGMMHKFEGSDIGVIPNILFAPGFLAPETSRIYESYIRPFVISGISHMVFRSENGWQQKLLDMLSRIYLLADEQNYGWEMKVHVLAVEIWEELVLHRAESITVEKTGITKLSQARLRQMTHFMETNFQEKISLEQIARSASISKSEVLRCFKDVIHTSPIRYLNTYRLRKAKELLLTTEKTVTEIAVSVGFDNVSYFDRMFRREYGTSPRVQRDHFLAGHGSQGVIR